MSPACTAQAMQAPHQSEDPADCDRMQSSTGWQKIPRSHLRGFLSTPKHEKCLLCLLHSTLAQPGTVVALGQTNVSRQHVLLYTFRSQISDAVVDQSRGSLTKGLASDSFQTPWKTSSRSAARLLWQVLHARSTVHRLHVTSRGLGLKKCAS